MKNKNESQKKCEPNIESSEDLAFVRKVKKEKCSHGDPNCDVMDRQGKNNNE